MANEPSSSAQTGFLGFTHVFIRGRNHFSHKQRVFENALQSTHRARVSAIAMIAIINCCTHDLSAASPPPKKKSTHDASHLGPTWNGRMKWLRVGLFSAGKLASNLANALSADLLSYSSCAAGMPAQ